MPYTKRPPAVVGGKIYITGREVLARSHAFDASSGELRYTLDIEDVEHPPVVARRCCLPHGLRCRLRGGRGDRGDSVELCPQEIPSGHPPAWSRTEFSTSRRIGHVYALDAATGGVLWYYLADGPIPRRPVVTGGIVFLGSIPLADAELGQLRALDAISGEVVWSQEPTGGYVWSLVVVDGVLYAEDSDGFLRAIDPATGEDVWEFQRGHRFDGSYAFANGVVYVGSRGYGSGMYAFTAPSAGD